MNAPKESTGPEFSDAERAAMKERAAELKSQRGGGAARKEKDRQAVVDAIAAMPDADRVIAERLHAIVTENAPHLDPKTWYGFPAYTRDGKVVVFFKAASKYESRYATLGFEEAANLDDGEMWPTSYALTSLTEADEAKITQLVKRAAS